MKRKTKELSLSQPHPENAKLFLDWLRCEIEQHPKEIQDRIVINYDNMDMFGHPYFALEVPKS